MVVPGLLAALAEGDGEALVAVNAGFGNAANGLADLHTAAVTTICLPFPFLMQAGPLLPTAAKQCQPAGDPTSESRDASRRCEVRPRMLRPRVDRARVK